MHDENLHITPDPEKGFPQPDIPADEAWNKMAGLLNTEMPASPSDQASSSTPPSKPSGGGFLGGSLNFWGMILGVIAVVGLLTWVILNLSNKTETSSEVYDKIKPTEEVAVVDSSTLKDNIRVIKSEKAASDETIAKVRNKTGLPVTESVPETNVQPLANSVKATVSKQGDIGQDRVVSEQVSKNKNENKPSVAIQGQTENKDLIVEQGQVEPEANKAPGKENMHEEPLTGTTSKDTATLVKSEPMPLLPRDTIAKPANKSIVDISVPTHEAGKMIPEEKINPESMEKVKKSPGMPENLGWQIDVNGNIGQVYQKGRDANLFYGGMITGGLWNKKLNGGIETGLGWEDYKDYGSVTEHIQITDSIPTDTLGNFQIIDTAKVTAYKYNYQYLQIPLFISKQLFAAGRFSLVLKTGPLIGIMFSDRKTIDYISGPDGGEILSTENNDYSRIKLSWQWQVMAQFRWNFNDRFSLTLSPYGIFYLNNLYDSKNRPSNLPYGIGLNGGVIYRFK